MRLPDNIMSNYHSLFAILTLVLHLGLIFFNIFGFFLAFKYPFVKFIHCSSLCLTATIMLTGNACPLTNLEQWLKLESDSRATYEGGFIAHYLNKTIYIDVPPWLIGLVTTLLAATAIWLYFIRPLIHRHRSTPGN